MTAIQKPRMEIVDALRGFALAGIFICHMVEQYVGAGTPEIHSEAVSLGLADKIIDAFVFVLLRGKFIALFSFLFGLSFFIQMDNSARQDQPFGGRFLWRLLLLLAIGYTHSLFYRGDILTIYAVLGILLIPFFKLKTKWILGIAALLFLGVGRYIVFYFTQGDHLFLDVNPMDMESAHIAQYYNTIKNGSLLDVFHTNSWQGHLDKMNVQYGIFGRGYFTFAFFLIGLYAGRSGFFTDFRDKRKLSKKILLHCLILFVIALIITAIPFLSMGEDIELNSWPAMIGISGYDLINAAMTGVYISLFAILYRKTKPEKWLAKFAPYGRMALTNYIFQSFTGTLLLYGWGMGNLGEISNTNTFILSIVLIILQIWISKRWLRYFNYGPLEWIWRSATFFKVFPIKKGK